MSERWDRYNLAARLERSADRLITACERVEVIEDRTDVCIQTGTVCRIAMTLKALRTEERRGEPDDARAGSAV